MSIYLPQAQVLVTLGNCSWADTYILTEAIVLRRFRTYLLTLGSTSGMGQAAIGRRKRFRKLSWIDSKPLSVAFS